MPDTEIIFRYSRKIITRTDFFLNLWINPAAAFSVKKNAFFEIYR